MLIKYDMRLFQAYMEDHLNNKNRLDSEWAALCAYEAEPCAVTVARKVSYVNDGRLGTLMPTTLVYSGANKEDY